MNNNKEEEQEQEQEILPHPRPRPYTQPGNKEEELKQEILLLRRQKRTARLLLRSLMEIEATHAEKRGALKMIAEYLDWSYAVEDDEVPF